MDTGQLWPTAAIIPPAGDLRDIQAARVAAALLPNIHPPSTGLHHLRGQLGRVPRPAGNQQVKAESLRLKTVTKDRLALTLLPLPAIGPAIGVSMTFNGPMVVF